MKSGAPTAGTTVRLAARRMAMAVVVLTVSMVVRCRGDVVMLQQQNMVQIEESQIVSWVFNNHTTVESARRAAQNLLEARVDLAAQACTISPDQRTRLILAGEGDIYRFMNKFQSLRRTLPSGQMTQQEYQQLWQQLQPLNQEFARGLHSDDSLFARSLRTTLNFEQLREYDDFMRARYRRQYIGVVKGAIAIIENEVPLTTNQRQKLLDLILAQESPHGDLLQTNYKFYVVLYRISKVPEEQLKPIFLDNEWKVMAGILRQAQSMKAFFVQQGIDVD